MYQSHLTTYFLDGKTVENLEARLAFGNSGFLFGESVFTTAAIQNDRMTFYPQHLQRLQQNWRWLFDDSLSDKELGQFIKSSYRKIKVESPTGGWRVRVNIFKDEENRSRCLTVFTPWSFEYKPIENIAIETGLVKNMAKQNGVKQPNYSETFRRKRLAKAELLFVDEEDRVGEAATSNIIFFKDGEFICPENKSGIFQGIGVQFGLKGLGIKHEIILKRELQDMTGAWLINSLRGPQKVLHLEGRVLKESVNQDETIKDIFNENSEQSQELL